MITIIKSRHKLFKQPHQISDVLEVDKELYLIIGIQKFKIYGEALTIYYICQKLGNFDYVSSNQLDDVDYQEFYVKLKHDDLKLNEYQLGKISYHKKNPYIITEITGVEVEYTDIKVSFRMKRIYPISRKEAKAKYLNERKKRLELEVLS